MKGRPDLERIAQLKRECHKIFSMYDPDPDNFWLQHAIIRDLGVQDYGSEISVDLDGDEEDDDDRDT